MALQFPGQRLGCRGPGGHLGGGEVPARRSAPPDPPHSFQTRAARPPGTASAARAFPMTAVILARFLMMPASPSSLVTSSGPNRGHDGRVEAAEGGPEVFPLAQDREPGQAGLEGFQAQPFEDAPVIADRAPPLLVVIGQLFRGGQRPWAAQPPVGPGLSHRGRRPRPRSRGGRNPGRWCPRRRYRAAPPAWRLRLGRGRVRRACRRPGDPAWPARISWVPASWVGASWVGASWVWSLLGSVAGLPGALPPGPGPPAHWPPSSGPAG